MLLNGCHGNKKGFNPRKQKCCLVVYKKMHFEWESMAQENAKGTNCKGISKTLKKKKRNNF